VRWLIDECVDAALAACLKGAGHDIIYMAEVAPRTADAGVMKRATDENRLLLTEDKDFGDLVFRQVLRVPGLVLVRIDPLQRALKVTRLMAAVEHFGEDLFGRYTVIEDVRFRSRPLRLDS